ncbi:type III-B CRISPR module-associated Cmr3 family protein [Roseofilum casamattae]|uniref:Type III-B CRISPR module-associated Cmr3 family protein n=1 Tax=Roseofilum casamattae BLCC-M143 TaxID=3022442 RepID=A0ABT7BSB5_9CYAN|nr:type III-B CRISPR module-associated Cmr3 family protein [Roseofilum casamattae]MDJ1182087.1 type III-B CRISPR module-associated Cmr3 family protein [Roseofilum casamattae BLCC-M143]
MPQLDTAPNPTQSAIARPPLQYLIIIEPLGLLYGSAGPFLSPQNLVGRSGSSFPPSAATLSGLFAAHANASIPDPYERQEFIEPLQFAGPFWAKRNNPQNFLVPTPFNCIVKMDPDDRYQKIPTLKTGKVKQKLFWYPEHQKWLTQCNASPSGKFAKNSWIHVEDWNAIAFADWRWACPQLAKKLTPKGKEVIITDWKVTDWPEVYGEPWEFMPHLHPRLKKDERRVVDPQDDDENNQGSLFLENGVQLHPDACLVYLANAKIPNGCYRFGGEGHLVDVYCQNIGTYLQVLLSAPLGRSFATITPTVWGSNRRSVRAPECDEDGNLSWPDNSITTFLTQRPSVFRYRLGDSTDTRPGAPKRLSRGRYAVPAGTVYVLEEVLKEEFNLWQKWPENWFPEEGISYKRFGCGLSLPLHGAIA